MSASRRCSSSYPRVSPVAVVILQFFIILALTWNAYVPRDEVSDNRKLREVSDNREVREVSDNRELREVSLDAPYVPLPAFINCSKRYSLDDLRLEKRLPTAYIIGQMKCGTGTLKNFLGRHPFMALPHREELSFYARKLPPHEPKSAHRDLMPFSSKYHVTLENAPVYLSSDEALKNMVKFYNNKEVLLVILRNPVTRAVSHFLNSYPKFIKNSTGVAESFHKYVVDDKGVLQYNKAVVAMGAYVKLLKQWKDKIPKGRYEIIDGNAFIKRPLLVLQRLERVLGIPSYYNGSMFVLNESKTFYCFKHVSGRRDCMPNTKGRPHPPMLNKTIQMLTQYYKPLNEELYRYLGRRLSWGG